MKERLEEIRQELLAKADETDDPMADPVAFDHEVRVITVVTVLMDRWHLETGNKIKELIAEGEAFGENPLLSFWRQCLKAYEKGWEEYKNSLLPASHSGLVH